MIIENELPVMDYSDNETGCCPRFHPDLWDDKIFNLDDLKFVKASTKSFFYMPRNMDSVMTNVMKSISDAKAESKDRYLILSEDVSKWKCNHYFLVDGDVPELESAEVKGNFLAKVFDGNFRDIPKWIKTMTSSVEEKGYKMGNVMSFYTTCPKCAKHYGHNYVVLFANIN